MVDQSQMKLQRRCFLQVGAGALAVLVAGQALAECGQRIFRQTMGPFYSVQDQDDKNWDLYQVEGRDLTAIGEPILISGRVMDESCQPISSALVEIWQACESGRYSHPGDTNDVSLDENFQYWGCVVTDEDGSYLFKTVVFGDYFANASWWCPSHIHFCVQCRGFSELVTQMYFAGNPLNDMDVILQNIPESERHLVIVLRREPEEGDLPFYLFDLSLETVRCDL